MRAFIFGLLVFCLWASFSRYYYVCEIKQLCEPQEVISARPLTLTLEEEDKIILDQYEEFAFDYSSSDPQLTENNELFLDTLSKILLADTSKEVTIIGYARPSEREVKIGFFEKIGQARADAIRQVLVQKGIAAARISSDYAEHDSEELLAPLDFTLSTNSLLDEYGLAGERLVKEYFTFTNMTFSDANFAYDSDDFAPGEPCQKYADSVAIYLGMNPEYKLYITGHTDDVGSHAYNDELGMRRAKSAADYFKELGVKSEIITDSKGKRAPMAPNDTPENQQKNRRVNFRIE